MPVEAKQSTVAKLSGSSQLHSYRAPRRPTPHFGISQKADQYRTIPDRERSVSLSASSPSDLNFSEILAPPESDGEFIDTLDVDYILDAVEQRERMMERLRMDLGPSLETISLGGDELSIISYSRQSTVSLSVDNVLDDEQGILDNMTIDELISGAAATGNMDDAAKQYRHKAHTVDL